MSDQETNKLPEVTEKTPKKEPDKLYQYIIGAISGAITCGAIVISSRDFGIQDQLIVKLQQYAFLIVFVAFMGITRRMENKKELNLRATRLAYMIAMGVGVLGFLIYALSQGSLSSGN